MQPAPPQPAADPCTPAPAPPPQYLSFVYWGFNLLLKIEFSGRTFVNCSPPPGAPPGSLAPCVAVDNIQAALNLPADPNASPALDIGVLFGEALRHVAAGLAPVALNGGDVIV